VIWHRQSLTALVLGYRLTESDITVMPSTVCVWIDYVGDIITGLT